MNENEQKEAWGWPVFLKKVMLCLLRLMLALNLPILYTVQLYLLVNKKLSKKLLFTFAKMFTLLWHIFMIFGKFSSF